MTLSISSHCCCSEPTTNFSCPLSLKLLYSSTTSGLIAFFAVSPATLHSLGLTLKNNSTSLVTSLSTCQKSLNSCVSACVPLVSNVTLAGILFNLLNSVMIPMNASCPCFISGSPPVTQKCCLCPVTGCKNKPSGFESVLSVSIS